MRFLCPLLLLLMFSCNNEDIPCSYNVQFCSAVSVGDMQEAANYIMISFLGFRKIKVIPKSYNSLKIG